MDKHGIDVSVVRCCSFAFLRVRACSQLESLYFWTLLVELVVLPT